MDNTTILERPLISVVIPVFNAEPYLRRCLDSVTGSTLKNIEIICVDDGSSDHSLALLREYARRDTRVRVLTQKHAYAGAARNRGVDAAKGEYIHFLDADDWIDRQAYEKWYRLAKENSADVCVCMYYKVDSQNGMCNRGGERSYSGKMDDYLVITDFHQDPEYLIVGSDVPWNKIYSRSFLTENHISFDNLICGEDRSFYFAVIYKAKKIATVREYWVYHYVNIATSLEGSGIRLKNFDIHFRSFENAWNVFCNATEDEKRMLLDEYIDGSVHFGNKAIGTEYEETIKHQMFAFWSPWLSLFGDDLFTRKWLRRYLNIIKDEEKKKGTVTILPSGFAGNVRTFVFSIDEKYAKYFSVTLLSLIKHVNPDNQYEIIVLYDDLSQGKKETLRTLLPGNVTIRFIDVKKYAEVILGNLKNKVSSAQWSIVTFYDLLVPLLMPDYERVLYCDSDVVFCDNIDDLFTIPFDGSNLIAVRDTVHMAFSRNRENEFLIRQTAFIHNNLGIDNLKNYFNAGILLFNINAINREEYLEKVLLSLSFPELPTVDQDVLNFVFKDAVKFVSERFNFQYSLFNESNEPEYPDGIAAAYFQAAKNPIVVHYTTHVKPWNTPSCAFGTLFWNYAKYSPFHEEIIDEILFDKQRSLLAMYNDKKKVIERTEKKNEQLLKKISALEKKNSTLEKKNSTLEKKNSTLGTSFSFKIGRVITFIPRKIWGGFRCLREHGFVYTLKRCWEKMKKLN